MKLRLALAALLVLFVGFGGLVAPPAQAHHRPGPCSADRFHWYRAWREDRNVAPVKRLIACAATVFGVPGGARKALDVASCETGGTFSPVAGIGQADDYRGIFQHDRDYWPSRVAMFTIRRWRLFPSIYNARTQAIVTARMAHAGGWGPWAGGACA